MINSENAFGMVPEDLLVAGAISEAIEDIRKNSWLLDYVFNWLNKDWVSKKFYGDAEKKAAIDWFLNNKIFVSPSTLREDQIVFPMVTIGLQQANEDLSSLGDVNFEIDDSVDPEQLLKEQDLIVLGPFSAGYDALTGYVKIIGSLNTVNVFSGQRLYDLKNKKFYTIQDVIDSQTLQIDADLENVDLNSAVVVGSSLKATVTLESVEFKQQYSIRCFVQNEPKHLAYLTALIRFILLRYKEVLLEGRGFQRSTVSQQGPYEANNMFGAPEGEFIFGQNFVLTGFVREYWPKFVTGQELGGFHWEVDAIRTSINSSNKTAVSGEPIIVVKDEDYE